MTSPDIPARLSFLEFGKSNAPAIKLPVLPQELRKLHEPWQIVLQDAEDRRVYFTKWDEDGGLEGVATPEEATQFDLRVGVLAGIHKAVELQAAQYNPDRLYIVDADRTSIAELTPDN